MRNAKAALKKHGLLLLNEMTGTSLFSHLTFGLLEGWWAYEDAELRVLGCPALTAESWQAVLSSEGLEVISLSETTGISGNAAGTELARDIVPTTSQEAGQQVIVAESDGVVRQPPVRPVGSSGEQAPTLQAPELKVLRGRWQARAPPERRRTALPSPYSIILALLERTQTRCFAKKVVPI